MTQESGRNAPRTLSRNSVGLDKLTSQIRKPLLPWMLYQYCARCSRFETLLLSTSRTIIDKIPDPIATLANQMQVPIVIVHHQRKDEDMQHPVSVSIFYSTDNKTVKHENVTWEDAAQILVSVHQDHKVAHNCGPGKTDLTLLPKKIWRTVDSDSSVSNLARRIPGVRHIDVDAGFYCPQCAHITLLIEASSDGMKNTALEDKAKSTRMSRRLSRFAAPDAKVMLLQHHVQDHAHKKPVSTTVWRKDAEKPFVEVEATWTKVRLSIRSMLNDHVCAE